MSDNKADVLASEAIMARLERAAKDSSRGQKRLETLRRLKIACDDIASGKAVDYAEKAGADSSPFKIRPRRINSRTVGDYIRIRRRSPGGSDGDKLWPGPDESTLRGDVDLKSYLDARQTEANGFQKKGIQRAPGRKASTISCRQFPGITIGIWFGWLSRTAAQRSENFSSQALRFRSSGQSISTR